MPKSVAIIGAGVAGLCAGIYAQMNGYHSQIFEMNSLPGGLCTAWKRRGYTIDGCIHWLVGSGPGTGLYQLWNEVGLLEGRQFVDHDCYMVYEGLDGRKLWLWADPNRLEQHMRELAPQDGAAIKAFTDGVRLAIGFDPPVDAASMGVKDFLKLLPVVPKLGKVRKLLSLPMSHFANQFSDPLLRSAICAMWPVEMSSFFMFQTLAWLHRKQAGYPIGGSLPLAKALEARYLQLGGQIHYNRRVDKILVEGSSPARAVGIHTAPGETRSGGVMVPYAAKEIRADAVISASDGHATLFELLDERFMTPMLRDAYQNWKIFQPILIVAVGVKRTFEDEPATVSGLTLEMPEPLPLPAPGNDRLLVHHYNFDPTLNQPGRSTLTVYVETDFAFWKQAAETPAEYEALKQAVIEAVITRLDQRWPGLRALVEMTDLATPLTFERYTHNWQGTYEGWLATPQNAMTVMPQTLPGLDNFYMAGHWVQPGGGLPAGLMTGRGVVQKMCKADGQKFTNK
jgi:phytoene dehydrogenase-like protein